MSCFALSDSGKGLVCKQSGTYRATLRTNAGFYSEGVSRLVRY